MGRRIWPLLVSLLLCCLCITAFALEQGPFVDLSTQGIRIETPTGWHILTPDNLTEQEAFLESMGTTRTAMAASMESYHITAQAYTPEGLQLSLRTIPITTENNIWHMDADEEASFQTMAAAAVGGEAPGHESGLSGFYFFTGTDTSLPMEMYTLALCTATQGHMYIWQADIIGRQPGSEDEAALLEAAKATLFLGAIPPSSQDGASAKATLPPMEEIEVTQATVRVTRDATPITIDFAPATSNTSSFIISGTTEPDAPMRYYLDGDGQERFDADGVGRFTIEIKKLKDGDNNVMIQSIGENGYGNVVFSVFVDRARVPLAADTIPDEIHSRTYIVTGISLPGAAIELIGKQKTFTATADQDGRFACEVIMPKMGANPFTLRAVVTGYKRQDIELTLQRARSKAEETADLKKKAKKISYEKLTANPANYKGNYMEYTGVVQRLFNIEGQPGFVFAGQAGENPIAVYCDDLLSIETFQGFTALVECTGDVLTDPSGASVSAAYPVVRLIFTEE